MIFIDADYFIGLYYKEDAHHKRCIRLSKEVRDTQITSLDVIDESITKIAYFIDKESALDFLNLVEKATIEIIYPTPIWVMRAKDVLKQQTLRHVSWTDCMNMAIAKQKGITTFLSFDKIYEKNGFKLLK